MTRAEYERYQRYMRHYAEADSKHGGRYIYLHAHEDELWKRTVGRDRPSENRYKAGEDFYWEHLADCYMRAYLEMALRVQGHAMFLTPSRWHLPVPLVVDWQRFGAWREASQVLATTPNSPTITLTHYRNPGVFSMSSYFTLAVASSEAAAARHLFFTTLAEHKHLDVYVAGEDMDLLRERLCFY